MEEDKNLNRPPVQNSSSQQTSSAIQPVSAPPKPKFKLPILFAGIIIFLLLIGTASATFIFIPKSSQNKYKQADVSTSPQPTNQQITTPTSPSPSLKVSSPTSEPDPTANWKTYINTKVGFQIKYPVRYSQPGLPGGPGENNLANGSEDNAHIIFGTTTNDSFGIQVLPFSGNLDTLIITSQATAIPPYDWQGKTTTIQKDTTLIANTPGMFITANYKNSSEFPFTAAFLVGKNHGFIFNFSQNYDKTELNQILSSFKFTN